jgi:dUTP pyrophosphatase
MKLLIKPLNEELYLKYSSHTHYNQGDSGLDLFFPENITVPPNKLGYMVDLQIQSEALNENYNLSYWLMPRSSISKTPLRMSNSMGLIDAGYRGNIMVALDNHSSEPYTIQKDTRLFQICSPILEPINLKVLELTENLSETERGNNGFGSTGK